MNKAKTEIRLLLSSLNQFLKKIPEPLKVNRAKSSISELLKKYDVENQGTLEKLTQELKYKYNFYKLAYPNISNELDKKFEANNIKEEVEKTIEVKFDHNLYWNDMIDESENKDNKDKKENINKDDIKTEEKMKTGTYVIKDGKLVPGEASKRKLVDFSNWVASNVDPEDLKKHRDLLDRQHFRGPMWEGKKIPPSILDEKNPVYNMDVEAEINPNLIKEKDHVFEKVKR